MKMRKRIMSSIVALTLFISYLPCPSFAAEVQGSTSEADNGETICICGEKCTDDNMNTDCLICASDISVCKGEETPQDQKLAEETKEQEEIVAGDQVATGETMALLSSEQESDNTENQEISMDLVITGGTIADGDYSYDETNHMITILKDTALTISGTTKQERIVVPDGIDADITLDNVAIANAGWSVNSIDIGKSTTTLALAKDSKNTLTAPNGGAAIRVAKEGSLIITGDETASLEANGDWGSGIGGYYWDYSSGSVTIKGGNITVTSGLGNCRTNTVATYTIEGGTLIADRIGYSENEQFIVKNGAYVQVTGEVKAKSVVEQGTLLANGNAIFGGKVTLSESITIAEDKRASILTGAELAIPAGKSLTVNGAVYNKGSIINHGTLDGEGTLIGNEVSLVSTGTTTLKSSSQGDGKINVAAGDVRLFDIGYQVGDNLYCFDYSTPIILTGTTSEHIVKLDGAPACKIELKDLSIDGSSIATSVIPLDLTGGKVELSFSGTNMLKATSDRPAIAVQNGTDLTISSNEGTLNLQGSSVYCASIGSHDSNVVGSCKILSGNITTSGRIGKWRYNDTPDGELEITGGYVTIGSGIRVKDCIISGGNVTVNEGIEATNFTTGENGTAMLRVGKSIADTNSKDRWTGIISENGGQDTVFGSYTLAEDYTVDNGMMIPEGTSLTVPSGITLTNDSIINVYGTLMINGTYAGNGKLYKKENGQITGTNIPTVSEIEKNPTIDINNNAVKTLAISTNTYTKNGVEYPYSGTITLTGTSSNTMVTVSEGSTEAPIKVHMKDADITNSTAFDLKDNSIVEITVEGSNALRTLQSGGYAPAALHVPESAVLTIQGIEMGSLTVVTEKDYYRASAAGIGGNRNEASGTITIKDCILSVTAAKGNAIGYGSDTTKPVVIENSYVTATGSVSGKNLTIKHSVIDVSSDVYNIAEGSTGVVYKNRIGTIYGDPTVPFNFENKENYILTIPENRTLTMENGSTLTNNGTIVVNGSLAGGTVQNNGALTTTDGSKITSEVTPANVRISEAITPNGVSIVHGKDHVAVSDGVMKITGDATLIGTGNTNKKAEFIELSGGTTENPITVHLKDIRISGNYDHVPISIAENSYVMIVLDGENRVESPNRGSGVKVPTAATLYLTCENEGKDHLCDENCGSLYASGSGEGSGNPGIGSITCGNIYIQGGNIEAVGATGYIGPVYYNTGAGIGSTQSEGGSCGIIRISGGNVKAVIDQRIYDGTPTIGGCGAQITIDGGTVTANNIGGSSFDTGTNGSAVISASINSDVTTDEDAWSGFFVNNHAATVYGEQILPDAVTTVSDIEKNAKLTIPDGSTLMIASGTTFTNYGELVVADGGTLKVLGDASNKEGGKVTVQSKGAVIKKEQNMPSAPTQMSVDNDQVTLNAIAAGNTSVEYACTSEEAEEIKTWQDSTTFVNLTRNKEYWFYARYKSNDYYEASEAVGSKLKTSNRDTLTADNFTFSVQAAPVYSGRAVTASVVPADSVECGWVTIKYYDSTGVCLPYAPVAAGTYTVKIDVEQNENFYQVTDLTDTSWTFTIQKKKVDAFDLANVLTAPIKNATPQNETAACDQYTGRVTWSSSPTKFLGNTIYTATVVLTATENYTLENIENDSFIYKNAKSVSYDSFNSTAKIVFPATEDRAVDKLLTEGRLTKSTYDKGDIFDSVGLTVTVVYDDGTTDVITKETAGYTVKPDVMAADTEHVTICYGGRESADIAVFVRENLKAIVNPDEKKDIINGTFKTEAALGLPDTVAVTTEKGTDDLAKVTWDLTSCSYEPDDLKAQTFTVDGVVTLPDEITNKEDVALIACISVSVKAAETVQPAEQDTTTPESKDTAEQISGLTEGQKVMKGTVLTITAAEFMRGDKTYIPLSWDANPSGSFDCTDEITYTATVDTAGMTKGAQTFTIIYREVNTADGKATGNIANTVIHYTLEDKSTSNGGYYKKHHSNNNNDTATTTTTTTTTSTETTVAAATTAQAASAGTSSKSSTAINASATDTTSEETLTEETVTAGKNTEGAAAQENTAEPQDEDASNEVENERETTSASESKSSGLLLWIALIIAAAGLLFILLYKRRKDEE